MPRLRALSNSYRRTCSRHPAIRGGTKALPPGLLVHLVDENHLVSSQNRGSRDYHKSRELSEGDIVPFPQLSFPLRVNEVIVGAEGRLGNASLAKPRQITGSMAI